MANLSDSELFDRLKTSLRSAIQHTKNLAVLPAKGPTYRMLVAELKLIEGSCRQIQWAREDMRWGAVANTMENFHQRVGDAIRHHNARNVFLVMANIMERTLYQADQLQHAKTGVRGPILPKVQPGPHRETRPVHISQGGIILPDAA